MSYLHGRTHGIEEVDNDEGEDGEPLFPRETRHGCVLSPDGLKFLSSFLVTYKQKHKLLHSGALTLI